MGIENHELLHYVIQPTLEKLGVESTTAEMLLLATANYHSDRGSKLHDNDGLGLFCISEALHKEVWDHYIAFDCELASKVRGMASQHEFVKAPHSELVTNLQYATAIAWLVYQYRWAELPTEVTPKSLADCWQRYFMNRPISLYEQNKFESCVRKLIAGVKSIAA